MKNLSKFELIERKILETNPQGLYFKNVSVRPPKDLKALILWILRKTQLHPTYSVSSRRGVQCLAGKTRSNIDIFLIARYYRPEITFENIIKTLGKLAKDKKISLSYCSTIERRTVFIANYDYNIATFGGRAFAYDFGLNENDYF